MKNILIVNAHPSPDSYCAALAKRYEPGAKTTVAEVTVLNLRELHFDATLAESFRTRTELEPDLVVAQDLITKANHIVFVYPNWWGTYPALLKAFFDRVFLAGFAFKYQKGKPFPEKLLTGKTARLIVTMDTPAWYYKLFAKQPGHVGVKKSVLNFCGIAPVKRNAWLAEVERLGAKLV
jgi:putative NADPH-quinone reductase